MNLATCLRSARAMACVLGALAACSSQHAATPDADTGPDAPTMPPPDAAPPMVTFHYTPGWDGVQSVEVLGGFGLATDWTQPLLALTASGATFSGTATLPPGNYLYVFHVVGDTAAGAKAAAFSRYAIDPASPAFAACPMASPTFSATEPNPCGQLTVPTDAAPPMFHVRGTVVLDGAPVAGYLVMLERDETASHHFFADRVTSASDGSFDLIAAAGQYRLQVQHPTFESMTDAQLAPLSLNIVRRLISSSFALTADMALDDADVAFADYAKFAPQTPATLPTAFTFGATGALQTRLEVYGTAMAGKGNEIGDPWFSSAATTSGTASFDGTFTTKQANETAVALGERYFWGIEQAIKAGSITWTRQSLVMPMTWH